MADAKHPRTANDAIDILAWSTEMVDAPLRQSVRRLPPVLVRVAEYHMGWSDAEGEAVLGDRGNGLRPALALASAQAVGGDPSVAIPAAVAVELVHNFSLLHDDVMDQGRMRRHQPTAWTVFGSASAVLTGDAMLSLAGSVLASTRKPEAVELLADCVQQMCGGHAADLAFEQREYVGTDEYDLMVVGKTGVLLGCACALGALFAGADAHHVELFRRFGEHLGVAFQLADDLMGIWGDPAVTGRSVRSDLRNRKKSYPVVAALSSGTSHGSDLAQLFRQRTPFRFHELDRAADLIERAGGRDKTRARAAAEVVAALDCLAVAKCRPAGTVGLRTLAGLATSQEH
ncbi:MAG TPA: polyprenyl synthetase family protein [Pseudonocardiaceae bacterium]|jgi:geranylgeranyl diphosphate synthase type I|nr:polyprenyl synthetase family protein [Pseudonocardiaceae bacterium]